MRIAGTAHAANVRRMCFPGTQHCRPSCHESEYGAYGDIRDRSAGSFASVIGRLPFLQTASCTIAGWDLDLMHKEDPYQVIR